MTKAKIVKEINRLYSETIVWKRLPKAYQTGMKMFKGEVVNFISSNFSVSGSLPLSDLPKLLQWMKEREISWDSHEAAWEEFVGHDTPNYYTTEELIKEWVESGNDR